MKANELFIPVYLNQRIVFDLIAMLEDGMATVTRVVSADVNREDTNQRYGAAFGLSQALSSLLKIDISGERSKAKGSSTETQSSEERVHTPASLFHKLLEKLKENELITSVSKNFQPKSGDIVQLSTTLKRNPVIQALDSFNRVMGIVTGVEAKPNIKKGSHSALHLKTENEKISEVINKVLESFRTSNTIDVVGEKLQGKFNSVFTLEQEFLNDPSMADLVDGEFTVIGKVIRTFDKETESINLLRKEFAGSVKEETLGMLFSGFRSPEIMNLFEVPEIEWKIAGPVLHVIPIAIYA